MRPRSLLWASGLAVAGMAVGIFALAHHHSSPSGTVRTSPPAPAVAAAPEVAVTPPSATIAAVSAPAARPAKQTKKLPSPYAAPGSAGMIVGFDPETGQLGMPTTEQLKEIQMAEDPMNWSDEGLEVVIHPDGSKSIDVQGRFMESSVVRMGPDGKLHFDCVQGEAAAKKLANTPVNPNIDPKSGWEVQ